MKSIRNFFALIVLCFGIGNIVAMDTEKTYSSAKKCQSENKSLRNSKEKEEKPERHITRKKGRRRLVSSKDDYMQKFLHEWDDQDGQPTKQKRFSDSDKKPKTRSRSGSFTITTSPRRSSTGEIVKKKLEQPKPVSPPMRRNSKGSIELTDEQWLILNAFSQRAEAAQEKIKLEKLNNSQD